MKVNTFAKFGIGLTAAALLTGAMTAPAIADPASTSDYGTLVGVGSDTTQDVMNGIAAALGGPAATPRIASYNATGTAGITPRSGGPKIDRPNGSGPGVNALLTSIGYSTAPGSFGTGFPTGDATTGQVDFARSSSGPGSNAAVGGVLTYIPYATDALDYAVSPASVFPTNLSVADLHSIYTGSVTQIVTGTQAGDPKLEPWSYTLVGDEASTPIHAYVPQSGSGTRKFWIGTFLGLSDSVVNSGNVIWSYAVSGGSPSGPPQEVLATGTSNEVLDVEEHDGDVLKGIDGDGNFGTGDPGAIMPFSIGKWIADAKGLPGVTDARHGAVLGVVGGDSATTGSDDSLSLNSSYVSDNASLTRPVYNVVPTAEVADPRSLANWAFVGTGSLVCSQSSVITEYGFQPLGAGCGATTAQAYAPAASTATVVLSKLTTKLNYGAKFTATATVTSNDNGGGSVAFVANGVTIDTVKVPVGSTTTGKVTVPAVGPDAGSWSVTAVFSPNLDGVTEGTSAPQTIAVKKITPSVTGSVATVSHTVAASLKVSVTASGFVPGGTVTVKQGSTTLATSVDLVGGKVTIVLPIQSKGTRTLKVTYNGSGGTNAKTISVTYKLK